MIHKTEAGLSFSLPFLPQQRGLNNLVQNYYLSIFLDFLCISWLKMLCSSDFIARCLFRKILQPFVKTCYLFYWEWVALIKKFTVWWGFVLELLPVHQFCSSEYQFVLQLKNFQTDKFNYFFLNILQPGMHSGWYHCLYQLCYLSWLTHSCSQRCIVPQSYHSALFNSLCSKNDTRTGTRVVVAIRMWSFVFHVGRSMEQAWNPNHTTFNVCREKMQSSETILMA